MTLAPEMKMTSIAPWFGGKRTLAADIIAEFGAHRSYWDIPCGSFAVMLAKPPSSHETAIDLHGDLMNLAMVIASDKAPLLYDRLLRTLYSESIFDSASDTFRNINPRPPTGPDHVTLDHVDRAYIYFIVSWMGRNGVAGTARVNYQLAVRYTPGGGAGGIRFSSAVDSLPLWHQRLRKVTILHRDLFEVLEKIDDVPGTVIYSDPPYFHDTRGAERYEFDFSEAEQPLFGGLDDHAKLAEMLHRFKKARIVVSYYDHPRIAALYPGWTIKKVTRTKALSLQNKRGGIPTEAPEVLILNGPSYVEGR